MIGKEITEEFKIRNGNHSVPVLELPVKSSSDSNANFNKDYQSSNSMYQAIQEFLAENSKPSTMKTPVGPFHYGTGFQNIQESGLNTLCLGLNKENRNSGFKTQEQHTAENSPSLQGRNCKLSNIEAGFEGHREELPTQESLPILNGYQYELSYIPSKGPRRRKRLIHCRYPNCTKHFVKAWNFLDHARMHLGEKPFS